MQALHAARIILKHFLLLFRPEWDWNYVVLLFFIYSFSLQKKDSPILLMHSQFQYIFVIEGFGMRVKKQEQ